jgi:hypothetical protein
LFSAAARLYFFDAKKVKQKSARRRKNLASFVVCAVKNSIAPRFLLGTDFFRARSRVAASIFANGGNLFIL